MDPAVALVAAEGVEAYLPLALLLPYTPFWKMSQFLFMCI